MLSRAPLDQMTATTVVGVLGRDDAPALRALVREIADAYGLAARVGVDVGSFSVRFERCRHGRATGTATGTWSPTAHRDH